MEVEEYIALTDPALVALVLAGDTRAFDHLFNRYGGSLRQIYLQRMGGKADDVDDLVQDVFIKAYVNLNAYSSAYTFGQWIYTIARNTFIDYIRRRREELPIDAGLFRGPASTLPDPEERLVRDQQRARLEATLERLSPKYRRLIELRFYKDMSYEEIAVELGLPLGTVKTQIHRARTRLSELIVISD